MSLGATVSAATTPGGRAGRTTVSAAGYSRTARCARSTTRSASRPTGSAACTPRRSAGATTSSFSAWDRTRASPRPMTRRPPTTRSNKRTRACSWRRVRRIGNVRHRARRRVRGRVQPVGERDQRLRRRLRPARRAFKIDGGHINLTAGVPYSRRARRVRHQPSRVRRRRPVRRVQHVVEGLPQRLHRLPDLLLGHVRAQPHGGKPREAHNKPRGARLANRTSLACAAAARSNSTARPAKADRGAGGRRALSRARRRRRR